jgi:hypothetical protein
VTFYRRAGRTSMQLKEVPAAQIDASLRELERDAASVFQTAYETCRAGSYLPPSAPSRTDPH